MCFQLPDPSCSLQEAVQKLKLKSTLNPAWQALGNQEHYILEPRLRLAGKDLGARRRLWMFVSWDMLGTTSGSLQIFLYQSVVRDTVYIHIPAVGTDVDM